MSLLLDRIIYTILEREDIVDKAAFYKLKNTLYREEKTAEVFPDFVLLAHYRELLKKGKITPSKRVEKLLRKRGVRSESGVAVISVLTKPWHCPGECTYCPNYIELPKSYVPWEPAAQRAMANGFDAVKQVWNRLRSLEVTGHATAKCDIRIVGGTWGSYPMKYREEFVKALYDAHTCYQDLKDLWADIDAANPFAQLKLRGEYLMRESWSIEEAKQRNETALSRVIGIAVETRPDWVTDEEIISDRKLGVTRVELGYQSTFDEINARTKRGHGNAESIVATRKLKDAGLKVVAHMMPNLPGATPEMDKVSCSRVWNDPDFRPDEVKIYPMVITHHTNIEDEWKRWEWTPYDDRTLVNLSAALLESVPNYVRINRVYRDIPSTEILAGSLIANLREAADEELKKRWKKRQDISAREIRQGSTDPLNATLKVTQYDASRGVEYFIEFVDPSTNILFALTRVRIPSWYFGGEEPIFEELKWAAIIRELHVFGEHTAIGEKSSGSQHLGFGRRLMAEAERIVREEYPTIEKIAVISGVGVKGYYETLGYERVGEYVVKSLGNTI